MTWLHHHVRAALSVTSLATTVALLAACEGGGGGTSDSRPSVSRGQEVYTQYCALCHGARGEGYVADQANALANQEFLRTASDDFLSTAISRGRPSTTMSAWSNAFGGPLTPNDVTSVVALLRSWQTVPPVTPPAPMSNGNVTRGAAIYAKSCATCHGATGIEGPYMQLANPGLLASADDAFLAYAVSHGRPGTAMAAWPLGAQELSDLVATMRSWQKPLPPGDVDLPGSFGPIVQNPAGGDPPFVVGQRYTPVDTVYAALQAGKKMILLDARAPSSYAEFHLKGAIDVPFYEAASYSSALPKDTWIVYYCGCPHAESGAALDALVGQGFTRVTVLDEGAYVWQARGYPTSTGNVP
jgi:cytochrome c oxidase cbb3-type subunit 3/ubiquinol-cytochrome c reductase cytochrome c subunit